MRMIKEKIENLMIKTKICAVKAREKLKNDDGVGVVEVILILLVLVGLVIIFRNQIKDMVENIFGTISANVDEVEI